MLISYFLKHEQGKYDCSYKMPCWNKCSHVINNRQYLQRILVISELKLQKKKEKKHLSSLIGIS